MMASTITFFIVAIAVIVGAIALPLANLIILFILLDKVRRIEQKLNQGEPR